MNTNADGLSRQDWDDTEQSSHGKGAKRESTFSGGLPSLGGGDVVNHPTKTHRNFIFFVQVM